MADFNYAIPNSIAAEEIVKLYLNDQRSDVNFLFEIDSDIEKISAHKLILGTTSPVFDAMFFGGLKESGDVQIVDATIDAFKEFLQIFYLPMPKLSMEHMKEVVQLADKYDVLNRIKKCITNFKYKLTFGNVCWFYQLSIFLNDDQMKAICENFIMTVPKKIYELNDFCRWDRFVLKHMLMLDSVDCNECEILDACLKWAKFNCTLNGTDEHKPSNWRYQLGDCFELIRFETIDTNKFLQHTVSYGTQFFTPTECMNIFYAKTTEPSQFVRQPRSKPSFESVFEDSEIHLAHHMPISNPESGLVSKCYEVFFSTSCPVLLNRIVHEFFMAGEKESDVTMKIFEFDDQTFDKDLVKTEVYNECKPKQFTLRNGSKWSDCEFKSTKPVFIDERKMYQITWEWDKDIYKNIKTSCGDMYNNVVTLDDRLTVKFHIKGPEVLNLKWPFFELVFKHLSDSKPLKEEIEQNHN